ncbi:hypothetical protein GQ473_04770 [archaeon]|nr:hypothetical protein [archaeon]
MIQKTKLMIIHADYTITNNSSNIRLFGRTEDGKSIVLIDNTYNPYFYAIPKKNNNIKSIITNLKKIKIDNNKNIINIKKLELIEKIIDGTLQKTIKIHVQTQSEMPKIKEAIKYLNPNLDLREYDIPIHKKYLADKNIAPSAWYDATYNDEKTDIQADITGTLLSLKHITKQKETPKILAFDLETIQKKEENIIILASVVTNTGLKKAIAYEKDNYKDTILVKNEKELIEKLESIIKTEDPDFIITYNGDAFDFPVIENRAKKLKCTINMGRTKNPTTNKKKGRFVAALVEGRGHIDLYQFISRIMKATITSEILTLNAVANELLGLQKKDMSWEQMKQYWAQKKHLDKIAEYCIHDSYITLKLAEHIIPNIFALSKLTKQTPQDVTRMTYGQLVEAYAINKATTMNIIVPNRPTSQIMDERNLLDAIKGAFVVEPIPGLHENIALFDFRSLYPSIIVSHNIDPFTIKYENCKEKVPGFDFCFTTKKEGFVPQVVKDLINERIKIKQELKKQKKETIKYRDLYAQQYALKTVSNAFYGYLGFAASRWYLRPCAQATTAFGRYYIHKIINMAEKENFKIIYGDTDSIFLKTGNTTKEKIHEFLNNVNKTLPGIMELEHEGSFIRGIFVAKKTGIGGAKKKYALLDNKGNITIRGFEQVRRDWSPLAKETQEKILTLVLNNKKQEAINYLKQIIKDLKDKKIKKEKLGIYTQLTRSVDKYTQIGPHVAAAKKAIAKGVKIHPGQTIQYIITAGSGKISDKAELFEFAKTYDSDYYLNNQILPASMRILSVLGITKDDILNKGKQKGLFGWN